MTYIVTADRPVYYAATGYIGDTEICVNDITQVTDNTGVSQVLDCVYAEDELDFIGQVPPEAFPDLPPEGTWIEKDVIYNWDGTAVMVRLSHWRTHHPPDETLNLFVVWRQDVEGLEWIYGEDVSVGMRRWYEGIEYHCDIAHVTEYPPPQAPALWTEVVAEGDPWQSGVTYDLGAVVTHNNATWESRRANNVWEPGTNDSGWLRTEPYPSDWYYLGGEGYPLDWEVHHNGYLWRNTLAGNHWTPGVWGWTQVEAV